MQQYADIYLLPSHSICLGCHGTHHQEYVGAVPYITLIQPQQDFTFSGIAGWVPVEL